MKRPVRSLANLAVVFGLAGCDSGDSPKAGTGTPAPAPTSASKPPAPEATIRDMKPADPKAEEPRPSAKADEPRAADEPPPLVPPAGAKDERPDAAKPQ